MLDRGAQAIVAALQTQVAAKENRFGYDALASGDSLYNYFRDYDSTIGRYIQSDPIGLQGGLNTFGYAMANPILYIDPTGEAVGGKWVDCSDADWETCRGECGSRGVKSCKRWWKRGSEMVGPGTWANGWKPAPRPSCNCNESCGDTCKTVLLAIGVAICGTQPYVGSLFLRGVAGLGAASTVGR